MRITFVSPNFHGRVRRVAQTSVGPPLGLAYLASAVRAAGHSPRIVDANALSLSVEETLAAIAETQPKVVGIAATTPTVKLAGEIAALVKDTLPDVVTIVGGPHGTALPERTLAELPGFDIVARGEAEETLPLLLDRMESGGRDATATSGFAFRDGQGGVIDNGIATPIAHLDSLLPPARDLLPMDRYRCPDSDSFTTLLAMRGCPAACIYCAVPEMFGRRMRYRDPDAVVDEMQSVHDEWGTTFFSFLDDTFTTKRSWVLAFCDALEDRGLHRKLRWICLTRADMVDRELLERMRRAGCVRVEMGIESGSETSRKYLRKRISEEAILQGFRDARAAGLSTMGFVMLNIPGETMEDLEKSIALAMKADPDFLQMSFLTPYPGTQLRDEAERKGWVATDDWARYSFLNNVVLRHGDLTSDELQRTYKRFLRRFYLRPRTAWKLGRLVLNGTTQVRPLLRTIGLGLRAALPGGGR